MTASTWPRNRRSMPPRSRRPAPSSSSSGPVAPARSLRADPIRTFRSSTSSVHQCHIPCCEPATAPFGALRYRWFRIYSDLLLHDLGQENADMCNGVAGPSDVPDPAAHGMRVPGSLHARRTRRRPSAGDPATRRWRCLSARASSSGLVPGAAAALVGVRARTLA